MASGKSLDDSPGVVPELFWDSWADQTYVNPNKDRRLAGKKRRRARRKT